MNGFFVHVVDVADDDDNVDDGGGVADSNKGKNNAECEEGYWFLFQ